jgi:hypothetical protein
VVGELFLRYPILRRDDEFLNTEVPSVMLEALRYPTPEIFHQISERCSEVLLQCFVAEAVVTLLKKDWRMVERPELYLPILLNPTWPLFHKASPLAINLLLNTADKHKSPEITVHDIAVRGYSLKSAMIMIAHYFGMVSPASRLDAFHLLECVFLSNPTMKNASIFVIALSDAARFLNVTGSLIKWLTAPENRFPPLVSVLKAYLSSLKMAEQKRLLAEIAKPDLYKCKSRELAIVQLAQKKGEMAFFYAAAETSDPAWLQRLKQAVDSGNPSLV